MMNNPKIKSALIGGGVFGVIAALPYIEMLNMLCCALFVGGGVLAVYFYLKEQTAPLGSPYGDGALIGMMAGVIGGIVTTFVGAVLMALGLAPDWADTAAVLAELESLGVEIPGVAGEATTQEHVEEAILGMELVMNIVMFGIFATIGGLVGMAIFHKKDESAE
ncbi:MAG: hypothetical protein OXH52_05320 [Gammaproteobacteria bacterium]|nr:hypothetical protein [Gammaproteobacteria bacterium]